MTVAGARRAAAPRTGRRSATQIDARRPARARRETRAQEAFERLAHRRGPDPRHRPRARALPRGRRGRRDRRGRRRRARARVARHRRASSARRCPSGAASSTPPHGRLPLPAPATLDAARGRADPRRRHRDGARHADRRGAGRLARRRRSAPIPRDDRSRARATAPARATSKQLPNVVRVILGTDAHAPARVQLIEANLDDLLPELAPDAAAACFAAGALDVWTTPIQMKRGRPGVHDVRARAPGRRARGRRGDAARDEHARRADRAPGPRSSSNARASRSRSTGSLSV